jgi:hypothetical protein
MYLVSIFLQSILCKKNPEKEMASVGEIGQK